MKPVLFLCLYQYNLAILLVSHLLWCIWYSVHLYRDLARNQRVASCRLYILCYCERHCIRTRHYNECACSEWGLGLVFL